MNFISIDARQALAELDDPRATIPVKRHVAADLVAALIDYLDDLDGDPDLEPSLAGWEDNDDREYDTDTNEADPLDGMSGESDGFCDDEPWLGAPEIPASYLRHDPSSRYGWTLVQGTQEFWGDTPMDDGEEDDGDAPELENEHGGDVLDQPHDQEGHDYIIGGGSGI